MTTNSSIIARCTLVMIFAITLSACGSAVPDRAALPAVPTAPEPLGNDVPPAVPEPPESVAEAGEMKIGQTTADQTDRPGSNLCDWVDKSDIIITVKFAEGVEKDISYETGFFFSPIFSNRKLARSGCDYRTGFSYEEMKGKGKAELGAIGYSDNRRRSVQGAPIAVSFDANGVPDIGSRIEITITD